MEFVHRRQCFLFCFTISTHHFTAHRKYNLNSSATRKYSCGITIWSDCAGNEGLLHRFKEARNFVGRMKGRNDKRIDCILSINCALKHFIEGKMEGRIEVT